MDSNPIHPGEHLAEILEELEISASRLARAIGVPPRRINDILRGRRSVTADTALRIGQALGMTPEYWLNLQRMYDLEIARADADVDAIKAARGWSGMRSTRPGYQVKVKSRTVRRRRSGLPGSGALYRSGTADQPW